MEVRPEILQPRHAPGDLDAAELQRSEVGSTVETYATPVSLLPGASSTHSALLSGEADTLAEQGRAERDPLKERKARGSRFPRQNGRGQGGAVQKRALLHSEPI